MRKVLAGLAVAGCVSLSACGGDDEVDGSFGTAEEVRDALVGTDFECKRWEDHSDTSQGNVAYWYCYTEENDMQAIQFPDDMSEWREDRVRDGALPDWVISGKNVGIDCYSKPESKCSELATILGL